VEGQLITPEVIVNPETIQIATVFSNEFLFISTGTAVVN